MTCISDAESSFDFNVLRAFIFNGTVKMKIETENKIKKTVIFIIAVVLLLMLPVSCINIQSVDDYYSQPTQDITRENKTVSLSISCKTVFDNWDLLDENLKEGDYIPKDGVVLPLTEVVLQEGDTVFDVLSRVVREKRIQMEYEGADNNSYGTAYIEGINYLYEFSCGHLSGWMYRVNGDFPNVGCSNYILKDGDVIEWVYTCDLGKDVGGEFKEQ